MHRQQKASELNKGEFPATAALTTEYVFRIENQATVAYLQHVGVTGQLVTLVVEKCTKGSWRCFMTKLFGPSTAILPLLLSTTAMLSTVTCLMMLVLIDDWWGFAIIMSLVVARSLNIILIRRRTRAGWHGALEPGVKGDLLVLLSQDRWVRLRGSVDALKAVTSGQWLKDMTFYEGSLEAIATMLVFVSAVLASNASQIGKIFLIALLLVSAALMGISNDNEKNFYMHGHVVRTQGGPKVYHRRLDLANHLIKETGKSDWAIKLGMVDAKDLERSLSSLPVTM